LAALSGAVSISSSQVSASIPKSSEAAIKAACGVQSIGSGNTSVRVEVNDASIGVSPLSLQGESYKGTVLVSLGTFNQANDCMMIYVCNQAVKFVGKCN
jgi:hypothetical protein